VSYGIYLMHMLGHNVVERALGHFRLEFGPLDFALTALLTVGVATLSQRYYERLFLPREKRAQHA
jgi:peptidoglycan/LPS O-acetylase OafA/YrhL